MSDPILINQIIQSEGLTGKKAELRRKELENKSSGALQSLLSNANKQVIFNDNIYGEMGWKPVVKPNPKYTEPQAEAMGFMHDMLKSASETLAEQDKKDNWISKGLVNFPKEVFNSKYAKSNVQAAIDSTKEDFNKIEDSARKVPSEFEETFQQLRGVKFDEKKIADCSKKAKAMAEFQASTDTIDALKSQLGAALVNTSGNNVSRSGEKAILKTLSTMGYTKIGEVIQAAMKGHENDPEVKDYMKKDGRFAVKKDDKGEIGIYRETENGWQPITQKQAQIIGKEIELRLNKLHSEILGVEIPENASSDDIAKLNETKLEEHRADYEKSFSQAYGKKDLKELSENYMLSQEKGQAYVQMGVNMLAMAGAMFSGGGTLALVSTGVMLSNPVGLIQMATDADGMTVKDWKAYGEGALEQAGWMALGMGAGKVGDLTRSFVKVKGLSKVIKDSGKSFDDFLKIAAKSPDISPKLASSLKSVSRLANTAGVTTEVAADMATTIALQKDGATEIDWAMSIGGALVGTKMQKVLAPMSKDAKVKHIMETFKDFKIDEKEANHLLKAMQDAESGAAPANKPKVLTNENHIHIPSGKFAAPNSKFAETDEAFKAIVHNRAADIKKLNEIDNIDEFCQKGFDLLKEEMGIEDSNMELVITDNDNHYDLLENKVYISRNWAGHRLKNLSGKGDKAEIFGGMAHELNHYLQWKEVVLNLDTDNPYWGALVETLQTSERASDNIAYLLEKYPDNSELKEFFDKAKTYENNWKNYVDAFDENGNLKTGTEYEAYKNQTVEAESFRRGDIVTDSYRDVIGTKETATPSPAKISGVGADDIQAPRSVKSNKKDFMHRILSLKDEKGNQIISEFTAQKLVETYGEENVPHLTELFDDMKSKYGDEEFAGKLFAAYTTNNTTVKSKDFDFVRQFMDEFKDTPENRESLVELVSSMNDKNKQAAKILLDMSIREPSTKDYWSSIKDLADVVPQFSQTKTLAALKRAQQLKDFDGKNLFSVRDVSIISGETDLLNSKLFDDTEIMKMYYVGPELGNQKYVMKILSAKENADLLAEIKEVLKNDVQKSEDFSKFFKGLMAIKPKISEKMIPLMINDIQDKTVKSFVKRNIDKLKTNDLKRQFITDMTSKAGDLSNVNDKYILSQINRRIDCIIDFMSSNNDYTSFYDEVTNLVNIDKGLRGIDVDSTSNASEYLKYMEENNPQKAEIFKDLVEKYPTMSADEFEEYSYKLAFDKKLPYLVLEEEFLNTIPNYIKDKKIQDLKAYFRDNFQDEMNLNISESQRKASRRLYNDKYLSTLPENTRAMCEKIHDSFGVKMFLCDENDDTSLHLIYNELLEWQKASRGKAELPAIIDLSLIRTRYIDEVFSAGEFCTGQDLVSIRGNYMNSIKHAIRHEIAHANDETVNIKSGDLTYYDKDWKEQHINIDDIIVHKKETKVDDNNKIVIDVLRNDNGTPVPDLDKCKYVEEFRNAGIPTYQINYAYTNKAEFVAVAAEGDYSKYSPEFKELLVNLGLPKWMFKMKNKAKVTETPFNVYKNEKFSDKYTFEENKAISANSEKMFNLVAKKQSSVHSDYFDFQLLGYNISARLDSRVKDFNGINEKIYRELDRLDEKIADVSDIDTYNATKLKKGDEPLTQEMADALIEKYNIQKQNLIYNYDTVHDTLQDTFGARLVMDDTSPQAVAKVHKTLLDNIDSGKFKILEINNYQGAGGIPYFSSAQIKQIQAHCRRKGYEVNIVSDVNAPKGKEAEYKNAFNSEKAVKSSGYTTCQMNIEHPSGVISEFQIRGKHLNELAESEHIFYDISQNKNLDKGNFAIKQITDPLIKVVEEMNLPENKAVKDAYSQYLTECYKFARMQELGIPMKKPELPKIVNPMLDIDNIISIHSQIQNLS